MKTRTCTTLAAAVLFIGTGASFAGEHHDAAKKLKDAGEILPLEQVLQQVRQDRPGRVVETELEKEGRRYIYEIKVVDDEGVVHELKYDARDGERLKEKREK